MTENNMSSVDLWKSIWSMQADLNKIIGLDSLSLRNKPSQESRDWLWNFCDEAINEAFEAKENFLHKWWVKEVKSGIKARFIIMDMAKLKVELIDVLHFLISACHINGDVEWFYDTRISPQALSINTDQEAYRILGHLIHSLRSSASENIGGVAMNLMTAVHILRGLFTYCSMTPQDIFHIYSKKHKINIDRQNNSYSQEGKTEADNERLEAEIRKSA